ncbi:MAG: hypothetical protein QNL61_06625 [Crocinitomicaceae bacterium]
MNLLTKLTLISFFTLTFNTVFGAVNPPDTTTSFIDKTASVYFLEEGKVLYEEGKIKAALVKFREAGLKDPYSWKASYWIGQCHYYLNNYGYALKYAHQTLNLGGEKVNDEIYYRIATANHRLGNLDSAIVNYKKALSIVTKTRAKVLNIEQCISECEFAKKALEGESKYTRTRLKGDINSGYDDYNIVPLTDGKTVYFTSRRSNTTGGGMNPDDQTFFEDVYMAKWNSEKKEWGSITNYLGKLNSIGFDALNYVSPDTLYGVMTLNSTETEDKKTTKGSDICEIKRNSKGTWNTPHIIKNKTINTSYFEGAATLTADGNTMYFVTDRKGEKSSTDIYVVEKNGKNWGTATPLPLTINTAGRETTPFITPDGRYLFYSSDGLLGMGGLDIYVVENQGGIWGTPMNLGSEINTVNNDTHFVYSAELKKAYISGFELIGDKASIDIYEIDMSKFVMPK